MRGLGDLIDAVGLAKKSDRAQRQRAAFVKLEESISRKAQKLGTVPSPLVPRFAWDSPDFWARAWFFTVSTVQIYPPVDLRR